MLPSRVSGMLSGAQGPALQGVPSWPIPLRYWEPHTVSPRQVSVILGLPREVAF